MLVSLSLMSIVRRITTILNHKKYCQKLIEIPDYTQNNEVPHNLNEFFKIDVPLYLTRKLQNFKKISEISASLAQ